MMLRPPVKIRILVLVFSYFVLGLVVRWSASLAVKRDWFYGGWIFVQAVVCALLILLGLWGILGRAALVWRATGCLIGIVYAAALIAKGFNQNIVSAVTLMLIFFPVCAVAGQMVIRRFWKMEVKHVDELTAGGREAIQFSILHLLLLTVAVGCMISLANFVRAYQPGVAIYLIQWGELRAISATNLLGVLVLSISFFTITMTALWATLGSAWPWWRLGWVVAVAVGLGLLYPYVRNGDPGEYLLWAVSSLLTTVLVVAGLLVVRSCGVRLVAGNRRS